MKLGKVKKICMAAEQLCVLDLGYTENMVLQWIGTAEAMYPMRMLQLSREQLQQVWELSEGMITAMETHPVEHEAELFEQVPSQIDRDHAEPLTMAEFNGYWALRCGESGIMFVQKEYFAPCMGAGPINLMLEMDEHEDWWVAIYVDGVLDGLVRPVEAKKARALHKTLQAMAGRKPVPVNGTVEEAEEEQETEQPKMLQESGQQLLMLPPADGEVE